MGWPSICKLSMVSQGLPRASVCWGHGQEAATGLRAPPPMVREHQWDGVIEEVRGTREGVWEAGRTQAPLSLPVAANTFCSHEPPAQLLALGQSGREWVPVPGPSFGTWGDGAWGLPSVGPQDAQPWPCGHPELGMSVGAYKARQAVVQRWGLVITDVRAVISGDGGHSPGSLSH